MEERPSKGLSMKFNYSGSSNDSSNYVLCYVLCLNPCLSTWPIYTVKFIAAH
ncbi:MAG: hypothetical protein QW199_01765 [Candidatus Pacearchaeota archaeon]